MDDLNRTIPAAPKPLPRIALFLLGVLHAGVFAGAAVALPWPTFSAFAVVGGTVATAFFALAVTAAIAPSRLPFVFRAAASVALAFLVWATWELGGAALYLVRLYAGIGAGLAGAAGAAWCVIALFTLPIGVWGLAATGGLRGLLPARAASGARLLLTTVVLLAVFLLAARANAARGRDRTLGVDAHAEVQSAFARGGLLVATGDDLAAARDGWTSTKTSANSSVSKTPKRPGSLFVQESVECVVPVREAAFTLLAVGRAGGAAERFCAQGGTLEDAAAELARRLAKLGPASEVVAAIDLVREIAPLPERGPLLGAVSVRPGLDGVCWGRRCLPPWLTVAQQQFTTMASFPSIQLDLGATAPALRKALGAPESESFTGLERFESVQLLLRAGTLVQLERGRLPARPPVDEATLKASAKGALSFVIGAQQKDGRFRYLVDPHTGSTSFANFSVPRQAGTTLAVCEMGALDRRANSTARKSLEMIAGLERRDGERGGIVWPKGATKPMPLGNTALSMIAFLACRERVGDGFDPLIHRMGRLILDLQRPDGGFSAVFDPAKGGAVRGPDAMYAAGQAVMALVLWESLLLEEGDERPAGTPDEASLRAAIDRAMTHFAGPYWDFVVRDFFFFEENWHCLAARAAIANHRHDAYERFCIDYVKMKARLVHDEHSGSEARLVGAYGFGTVFPPHNTATAGFGEALAGAIAVARARGLDTTKEEALMEDVLGYLLQQQWTEATCFACTDQLEIPGAFGEHYGEPTIRIDYVQHALAALGHGGRSLGFLQGVRAAGVPREVSKP